LEQTADLNALSLAADVPKGDIYRIMAEYLGLEYVPTVNLTRINLAALPELFMKTNLVVALRTQNQHDGYLLSDPFNWPLLELLKKHSSPRDIDIAVTEPEKISSTIMGISTNDERDISKAHGNVRINKPSFGEKLAKISIKDLERTNVVHIADAIIYEAVEDGASDIHLEPKSDHVLVRLRVDGDMRDVLTIDRENGAMVLARLKALGRLDIAERHKPQDGALEVSIDNRTFKLRLATSSTPMGESMIIRLLEPEAEQRDLLGLGMTERQAREVLELANRQQGLLLVVGPVGSGKTTTLYSLLSRIDLKKRSLLSVEDPVEYRIPFANQQQVNEKAGVSFDALLKSAVRQDPNILFIGEIRDTFSAKIASDFASIGHLTVSTMHAATATSAIFRLERLGIHRAQMADALEAVVAQRLLKKLCPHCREVVATSKEEYEMLAPFTDNVPSQVGHPVGCPECDRTGYRGREGVFEVVKFDSELLDFLRENRSIAEIRTRAAQNNGFLLSNHALEKVGNLTFSPRDIYEKILLEEPSPVKTGPKAKEVRSQKCSWNSEADSSSSPGFSSKPVKLAPGNRILVVEDDEMTQVLLESILQTEGYETTIAADGIDAMVLLSKEHFDLILSDIEMPNLDGFRFLEVKNQKGVETPVVFLTGLKEPAEEVKAFALGALDFIRKPFDKDVLLTRIKRLLGAQ
jgi:type IV pilus assembly protein PilB